MASVTLYGVWLAPVSDLTDTLVLNGGTTAAGTVGVQGDFRRYAGGRVRLIRQAGQDESVAVSVSHVSRTTREQLNAWAGETLLLRDGRGRLVFGTYLAVDATENPGLPYCDLSLTFTEITTTIEV